MINLNVLNQDKLFENDTMNDTLIFNMISNEIGELVLNQPKRRNALNADMWKSLPSLLQDAVQVKNLKVLIVRGAGYHFAAGADISEFASLYSEPDSSVEMSHAIANAMHALANFPLPTLAMIRGACVGGGCALALCCDVRFADNTAKFAITPARLGLVYPYNDMQRLIEVVGLPTAKDMTMSARVLKAREAKKVGLINFRSKPDDLEMMVMEYANAQAALSRQSLRIMKQMFAAYQSGQRGDNEQTRTWFESQFRSNDFKEGYIAFMGKRKPEFK